jgi:hypothetical protein
MRSWKTTKQQLCDRLEEQPEREAIKEGETYQGGVSFHFLQSAYSGNAFLSTIKSTKGMLSSKAKSTSKNERKASNLLCAASIILSRRFAYRRFFFTLEDKNG